MRFGDAERAINLDDVLAFVDHLAHYFLTEHALEHAVVLLNHLHEVGVVGLILVAFGTFAGVLLVHVHFGRGRICHDRRWLRHQLVSVVFI